MHTEEIIKIIDNLKGKRKYEEKKSKKLIGVIEKYAFLFPFPAGVQKM